MKHLRGGRAGRAILTLLACALAAIVATVGVVVVPADAAKSGKHKSSAKHHKCKKAKKAKHGKKKACKKHKKKGHPKGGAPTASGPAVKRTAFFYWTAPVAPSYGTATPRSPERYQRIVNGDSKNGAMQHSTATKKGVEVNFQTQDLKMGHAYTAWIAIFNKPQNCTGISPQMHSPDGDRNHWRCNDWDQYGPSGIAFDEQVGMRVHMATGTMLPSAQMPNGADVSIVYLAGGVANYKGRIRLSGYIPTGKKFMNMSQHAGGDMVALKNPLGAEYHVTIVDHGVYDPKIKDMDGYGQTESMMACNGHCTAYQASGADAGYVTGLYGEDELPMPM